MGGREGEGGREAGGERRGGGGRGRERERERERESHQQQHHVKYLKGSEGNQPLLKLFGPGRVTHTSYPQTLVSRMLCGTLVPLIVRSNASNITQQPKRCRFICGPEYGAPPTHPSACPCVLSAPCAVPFAHPRPVEAPPPLSLGHISLSLSTTATSPTVAEQRLGVV